MTTPSRWLPSVPLLQWGREYNQDTFTKDMVAAVIVTIMLIPQSLAYALLAGLPPEVGLSLLDGFEAKGIGEIWINPGAESDELMDAARRRKLNVIEACSIMSIGQNPYAI